MPDEYPGVAGRLYGLLVQRFGSFPRLTLTAWDGSRAGDDETVSVHLRSRKAVRRLLWTPGALGIAQGYVTNQIDVDGEFVRAVRALLDYRASTRDAGPVQAADRREIVRVSVVTGAVGPAAGPPSVSLAAIDGYAPVEPEMAESLPVDLVREILGEDAAGLRADATPADGVPGRHVVRHVTEPEPLSVLVRQWEDAGIVVEEVRRVDGDQSEALRVRAERLEQQWDEVSAAVGEEQARAWRLAFALDREYLERGRVAAYQVCGVARSGPPGS